MLARCFTALSPRLHMAIGGSAIRESGCRYVMKFQQDYVSAKSLYLFIKCFCRAGWRLLAANDFMTLSYRPRH